jgi:hypothetical protein
MKTKIQPTANWQNSYCLTHGVHPKIYVFRLTFSQFIDHFIEK